MLMGDSGTAEAIAKEVGIVPKDLTTLGKDVAKAMVMTASDFDKLEESQVDALPTLPLVIARCSPTTKVRMIEALHRRKRFVAMVCSRKGSIQDIRSNIDRLAMVSTILHL